MTDCVFCKIVAKQIPAAVVHEDEHTLAFMDIGQVNPGHVLVAARAHCENVYALDDEQAQVVRASAVTVHGCTTAAGRPTRLPAWLADLVS